MTLALSQFIIGMLVAEAPLDDFASRLSWGGPCEDWTDLGTVSPDTLDLWLDLELECNRGRGMDAKAAAAYLVGHLGHALATGLIRLHHAGLGLDPLPPCALLVQARLADWQVDAESGSAVVIDLRIEPGLVAMNEDVPEAERLRSLGRVVVSHMGAVIAGLHARTGLPPAAQWRQLSDSVTAAFLAHGKAVGLAQQATEDAMTAIAAPSPLWNRQVGFVEARLPAEAGRPEIREWFRTRGGCCRYHTMDGGTYCSTCVHRDPESRDALLLAHMRDV